MCVYIYIVLHVISYFLSYILSYVYIYIYIYWYNHYIIVTVNPPTHPGTFHQKQRKMEFGKN